ncbi:TPA: hypothetical protein ACH3X1_009386 [Trebouxia sp. C0004]
MVEARQAAESAWANAAPPCILPHHFKVVKRTRDASASNMLAAEDAKCCRLSPHPTAANDLAEGESGVSAHDHGEWVEPKLLLAPVNLYFVVTVLCLQVSKHSVTAVQTHWIMLRTSY